jgi:hypothetical protein
MVAHLFLYGYYQIEKHVDSDVQQTTPDRIEQQQNIQAY